MPLATLPAPRPLVPRYSTSKEALIPREHMPVSSAPQLPTKSSLRSLRRAQVQGQPTGPQMLLPAPPIGVSTMSAVQATPRSILKNPADVLPPSVPPPRSEASEDSSAYSGSSRSSNKPIRVVPAAKGRGAGSEVSSARKSTGQRMKNGAFFAFVLLPMSCWYTRAGKRLSWELEGDDDEVEYPVRRTSTARSSTSRPLERN